MELIPVDSKIAPTEKIPQIYFMAFVMTKIQKADSSNVIIDD